MNGRRAEAIRYLGRGGDMPDARLQDMIDGAFKLLDQEDGFRYAAAPFDMEITGDAVSIAGTAFHSRALAKHLLHCDGVLLFAATLGAGADRLMQRFAAADISMAAVLQAAAAAELEARADEACAALREKYGAPYLTGRFSPGYGDLALSANDAILRLTDAPRRIGLSATAQHMLVPTKSITALIGMSKEERCHTEHKCALCTKTDCVFRGED